MVDIRNKIELKNKNGDVLIASEEEVLQAIYSPFYSVCIYSSLYESVCGLTIEEETEIYNIVLNNRDIES